jgi:hypothetical protein
VESLHIQMFEDPLQRLGVGIDDHHFLIFPGQPFSKVIAHFTGTNHDDFHCGSLRYSPWFIAPLKNGLASYRYHSRGWQGKSSSNHDNRGHRVALPRYGNPLSNSQSFSRYDTRCRNRILLNAFCQRGNYS